MNGVQRALATRSMKGNPSSSSSSKPSSKDNLSAVYTNQTSVSSQDGGGLCSGGRVGWMSAGDFGAR